MRFKIMTNAAQKTSFRFSEADIAGAFENNEFRLVYQPKVDLASGAVTGAEAFIRWQHPQLGLLPPGLFLDFVESCGRMPDLTHFVIDESVGAAAHWQARGKAWSISINVSPLDLAQEDFCDMVVSIARGHGVNPSSIIIETPERALVQEPEALLATLDDLRQAGVHVALDGGGIVPVDLSRFEPMPFTSIKVGGVAMISLAARLGLNGAGAVSARLRFARVHRMEAVAVGVEAESTIEKLREAGFTAAQGIWIQRPLALEELLSWDGVWARGNGALDIPVRVTPVAVKPRTPEAQPVQPAPPPAQAPKPTAAAALKPSNARPKPAVAAKAAIEELEDVVEDIEVTELPRLKGFLAEKGEACLPMKHLVERRVKATALEANPRGDTKRRSSVAGSIFGD
jgi:EAL domain-containing protein (putative c-di-GMP-specific phosphodiesterase class I)